jgi:hypothetical protein
VGRFCYFLSFRLVRNPSGYVFIQVLHQGIPVFDKFYLFLPAHILYLFFSNYGTPAVPAKLIINKLMQVIPRRKAIRIKVVLMLIYSSYEVIRHPNVQSRSRISHNIHGEDILYHPAIISEGFRASRNDIHTKAGRT